MPPVVSFVGKPDSGKTTLLEKLIPELNSLGYQVGTIKHHIHEFEMDTPGKDTWRHKRAGARITALSSPSGLGVIRDTHGDCEISELVARYFMDVDIVITEGYKRGDMPKIEVFRSEAHAEPIENPNHTWIAMVSDVKMGRDLPCFGPKDVSALAAFLVEKFIKPAPETKTALFVNGKNVPLNSFVQRFIGQSVKGMTASLNGCENPNEITITIHYDE